MAVAASSRATCGVAAFKDAMLLETLLHTQHAGFYLLSQHLQRMITSADALGWADGRSEDLLQRCLEEAAAGWEAASASRVRLLLPFDGPPRVERTVLAHQTADAMPVPCAGFRCLYLAGLDVPRLNVVLDSAPIDSADPRLRHKTTARSPYTAARARNSVGMPQPAGRFSGGGLSGSSLPGSSLSGGGLSGELEIFDVLLFNERGELTESTICNVAICQADGRWLTPAVSSGLLAGCFRRMLLEAGEAEEAIILVSELRDAVEQGRPLVLFNSVRGAFSARLLGEGSIYKAPPT